MSIQAIKKVFQDGMDEFQHEMSWGHPVTISRSLESAMPYPIDALPDGIRAAVKEAYAYVQAPLPMVASSALSQLSFAAQHNYDVSRDQVLRSPVSLFFLVAAESGERKSACDSLFSEPIRSAHQHYQDNKEKMLEAYQVDQMVWEATGSNLKNKIHNKIKNSEDIDRLKSEYQTHLANKPIKPKIPTFVYSDTTPEALAEHLKNVWPSATIMADEAGNFIGNFAIRPNSSIKSFALLNSLWDGKSVEVTRKAGESFSLSDARLSIWLMSQPALLGGLFSNTDSPARTIGFFSRILFSCPDSKIGYRPYKEPPAEMKALSTFKTTINALLQMSTSVSGNYQHRRTNLQFDQNAFLTWRNACNQIEKDIQHGHRLEEIKDVASKMPENIARMAALFSIYENPGCMYISEVNVERAIMICQWHMSETLRFLEQSQSKSCSSNASKLEGWLLAECIGRYGIRKSNRIEKNRARKFGPLRVGADFEEALEALTESNRIRIDKDGNKTVIFVNPKLIQMYQN